MKVTRRTFLKAMAAAFVVVAIPIKFADRTVKFSYQELLRRKRERAWIGTANRFEETLWK